MSKKTQPNGLNTLAMLVSRIGTLEQENKALKEALAVHENRLNNLSVTPQAVNEIVIRALRAHGQILIQATTPPEASQVAEDTQPEEVSATGG